MPTPFYGLYDSFYDGQNLDPAQFTYLNRLVSAQLNGIIRAWGAGILPTVPDGADASAPFDFGPLADNPSFLVAANGGDRVSVHAGHAVVIDPSTEGKGAIVVFKNVPTDFSGWTLDGSGNGQGYVVLALKTGTSSNFLQSGDSRMTALPRFAWSADKDNAGMVPLARVTIVSGTITSVEDVRPFVPLYAAVQLIQQLQSDLDYTPSERAKGTVASRLTALETPAPITGGGTGGGAGTSSFFTLAMYNALVAQLADLKGQIEAIKDSLGTDSPLATRLMGRVELLRSSHSVLEAGVVKLSGKVANALPEGIVIPGVCGQGETMTDGTSRPAVYVGGNLQVDAAKRRFV